MAIYNIFDGKKTVIHTKVESAQKRILQKEFCSKEAPDVLIQENFSSEQGNFFSSLAARLFFLLLFCADIFWILYSMLSLGIFVILHLCTFCKVSWFQERVSTALRSCKRSFVCATCLLISLFSPSFGIMIACTYFMMFDPQGIEEVVPTSLQSQFKDFFTYTKPV